MSWLDDHSRLALSVTAHPVTTGQVTLATFRAAVAVHGAPASTLTDNGTVYTTRFVGGGGGRNGLENELRALGVTQKNGRPNHPQTQGKVERFQQTLQKWLAPSPPPPPSPACRPSSTPSPATTTPGGRTAPSPTGPPPPPPTQPGPSGPGDRTTDTHHRVRTDIIGTTGTVTLRTGGKLHHIGVGRTRAGTHVLLLIRDLDLRIIDAATGELLRELTLDPSRNYQPTGRPPGPTPATPRPARKPRT